MLFCMLIMNIHRSLTQLNLKGILRFLGDIKNNSNTTSFFRFVNKPAIYRLRIISLAHAPVHVTGFPVVNVNESPSARIWQHKLCATLSVNVNKNYRLPIKVYYRIYTLRNIRIEIIHGSLWLGIKY